MAPSTTKVSSQTPRERSRVAGSGSSSCLGGGPPGKDSAQGTGRHPLRPSSTGLLNGGGCEQTSRIPGGLWGDPLWLHRQQSILSGDFADREEYRSIRRVRANGEGKTSICSQMHSTFGQGVTIAFPLETARSTPAGARQRMPGCHLPGDRGPRLLGKCPSFEEKNINRMMQKLKTDLPSAFRIRDTSFLLIYTYFSSSFPLCL